MRNRHSNGNLRKLEADGEEETEEKSCQNGFGDGVILGLDGGATSTVCVCVPFFPHGDRLPEPLPILGRAVAGCTNCNSVGETAARDSLEQVISEALVQAGSDKSDVRGVCLGVSGVNHPSDQKKIENWIREMFPSHVKVYVQNDAIVALASGTMGKLHGCVLIAGTGCIAYGFDEDGREARASGAGPILGDWGSGYGIAAQALTAVIRAHDGRGPQTMLTSSILKALGLSSPDELIGWTYADPSWARIAALVPQVVSCAEAGDEISDKILVDAAEDLAISVKAVVQRLGLCGQDGTASFPVVMVGGVLNANQKWDIGKEVSNRINRYFPGAQTIIPKVEPAVGAALLAMNFLTG
uniref:N-acetyl-D-glucosamine kinase n=1 Tax=Noccaea caerulescens TaxID=107243 RepID=A0A1J3IYL1_NOCCA